MNKSNIISMVTLGTHKSYTTLNNTNRKYEYETEILKYIGYIIFNGEEDIYNMLDMKLTDVKSFGYNNDSL